MKGPIKKLIILNILSFTSLLFTSQAVFAESNLSISISSNSVYLSLAAGQFGAESQIITASTSSLAGYKIGLITAGDSSALTHELDNSKTIPTFVLPSGSSSIPVGSIDDGYGYSVDGGANYLPIPEPLDNPVVLFQTSTAGSNNHTLTYGVKVPTSTLPGNYSNTFDIVITANVLPCPANNICYAGNYDDATGIMADQPASSNSNIDLLASNFSRPGYGFAGWNTEPDGSGNNYGPNQTITTGDLSVRGLQLYARWIRSSGNLQGWNGCSGMTAIRYDDITGDLIVAQNSITALTDSRDQNTYAVVKFADNQCWMIENLRLDLSNQNLSITDLNTNKPSADFSTAVNNNHPASSNSFCANNNAACNNQIKYNTNNTNRGLSASYITNTDSVSWYSYGHYYNWYTATAGNGTYGLNTAGASAYGDICPANWRLPSGYGIDGDLAILDIAMGGNGTNQLSGSQGGLAASKRWRTYPYNFILSGEYRENAGYNRGTSSSYATINAASASNAVNLWLKPDGVHMNSNGTAKVRGQTVRCLFNPVYHVTGNIHYDANGGDGTMSDDTNIDFSTAVASNNSFTKTHYQFAGWNTMADGSGVVVGEGDSVANAADRMHISEGQTLTLYAIWQSVYSLAYDGNGSDAGTMTNAKIYNLESGQRTLVSSNFSRIGYGFAGWSLDSSASTKLANGQAVTIYGPNQSITIDDNFLANADQDYQITLYAVWLPADSNFTMQSFSSTQCNDMEFGEIIALTDTRDDDVYAVARLEDGNCWMIENLRLNPSTTTFTSSNTNSPTADFIAAAPNSASSNTLCNDDDNTCIDTIRFNTNALNRTLSPAHNNNSVNRSWYSYGVMYNWYTASAGNGTYSTSNADVAGDICPVGWRLPTGGQEGEFVTLNNLANNASTTTDDGLVKFPDNFIYSGDYNYDVPNGRNSYGRYWSATPDGNLNAYRLGIVSSNPTPAGSYKKWDAFAVRCIKEGDMFIPDTNEFTLDYDAGSFATEIPEDVTATSQNSSYEFTISNITIPHVFGYQFLGYSEVSSDTTPDYVYDAVNNTFTPSTVTIISSGGLATKTLYAIFQVDTCPASYICYFDNGADSPNGGIGTMANQPAMSNSTVTLIPSNYSRAGYGFAGWITSVDAVPYGPNATIDTGDLTSSGLKLYAKWVPSTGNLQDWSGCNSMVQGDITALTDIRDNQTYAVAKLGDEKCWIVENLRLDPGAATITAQNTNNPVTDFIEASNDDDTHSLNTLCNVRSLDCINQIQYNANSLNRSLTQSYTNDDAVSGWYSYGVYYNWYTATAGNGTFNTTEQSGPNHDGVLTGDICPANWHLPTGGSGGEYSTLNVMINNGADNSDVIWRAFPNNFVWSGDYNNNKRNSSYSNGRIWTATTKDNDSAYRLGYALGIMQANANSFNKWDGFAVRCVFNGTATVYNSVTVTLPLNVSSVTFENDNYGTVTATSGNNTVSLARGATYTIIASPAPGYILDTWTIGASSVIGNSNQNPTTFAITDDTTLTLSVNQATDYTVTVNMDAGTSSIGFYHAGYGTQTVTNNNGNGDGTTTTTVNLYAGINYTITPIFSTGYIFSSWSTTSGGNLGSTSNATTTYSINSATALSVTSQANLGPEPPASCNTQVPNITYMQEINAANYVTILEALYAEQPYYLRDSRDGEPYCVSKLADGHLWMLDNLRLDLGDSDILANVTASNTNATAEQLQYLKNGGGTANDQYPTAGINSEAWVNSNQDYYSVPMSVSSGECLNSGSCVNESGTQWNKDSTVTVYGNGSGKVGVLYNYCAASAGTYCYGNGTSKTNIPETDSNPSSYYDLDGDICPAGWHIPTGNIAGDIYSLYNYYSYKNASSPTSLQYNTSIPFAGSFISGKLNSNPDFQGSIWTATRGDSSNPQQFIIRQNGIVMSNSLTHNYATATRCILETPVHTATIYFAGSGISSVSISHPAYGTQTVTTSGGTVTLRYGISYTVTTTLSDAGYRFVDYTTTSNGSLDAATDNPTTYVITGDSVLTVAGETLSSNNANSNETQDATEEAVPSDNIDNDENQTVTDGTVPLDNANNDEAQTVTDESLPFYSMNGGEFHTITGNFELGP